MKMRKKIPRGRRSKRSKKNFCGGTSEGPKKCYILLIWPSNREELLSDKVWILFHWELAFCVCMFLLWWITVDVCEVWSPLNLKWYLKCCRNWLAYENKLFFKKIGSKWLPLGLLMNRMRTNVENNFVFGGDYSFLSIVFFLI